MPLQMPFCSDFVYLIYAKHIIIKQNLACENIRFSSLFAAVDVSRGGTSATQRQKFHTDDAKSVRNLVRSADWSTEQLLCFSYCSRMTDKRQKATKVKCKREESLTKQSIFVEYSLLQKKHLSFTGVCWQMDTTLYQNRPEDTKNWTNLYLEPHDHQISYVNIDLRHQYGISAAESQRLILCAKAAKSEEKRQNQKDSRQRCQHLSRYKIKRLSVLKHPPRPQSHTGRARLQVRHCMKSLHMRYKDNTKSCFQDQTDEIILVSDEIHA